MNPNRITARQPLRHLWWLGPARLFALVIGSTMLIAALQSDAAYRLYGAPKFISGKHLLLAAVVIGAMAAGRRLAAVTGAVTGGVTGGSPVSEPPCRSATARSTSLSGPGAGTNTVSR